MKVEKNGRSYNWNFNDIYMKVATYLVESIHWLLSFIGLIKEFVYDDELVPAYYNDVYTITVSGYMKGSLFGELMPYNSVLYAYFYVRPNGEEIVVYSDH